MTGLKTGVKNDIIWSEMGSGFGEPAGTSTGAISYTDDRYCPDLVSTSDWLINNVRNL